MIGIIPICNDEDLQNAFERISELWGAESGTPEGDELDILAVLAHRYEDEHYPMPPAQAIK